MVEKNPGKKENSEKKSQKGGRTGQCVYMRQKWDLNPRVQCTLA